MNEIYACTANNKHFILNGLQISKIIQAQKAENEIDLSKLEPISALELFKNKITCGDAIELTKLLPDNSIDAVITDPPYNSGALDKIGKYQNTGAKYASRCPFP